MCGRFTLFTDLTMLQERFDFNTPIELQQRFNIAPSHDLLAVVSDGQENRGGFLKWGLIPVWAKDPKIGYKMINARPETVDQKPAFKRLLEKRRCIILADSFYEWKKVDGEPFAFAGLWDHWEEDNARINSCAIITTRPNELMKDIHDRMPVILTKETESDWLDRSITDIDYLKSLLTPFNAEEMGAYEVSSAVGSTRNDDVSLIEAVI
jgi:putative SOS response-associated peptidase YedK